MDTNSKFFDDLYAEATRREKRDNKAFTVSDVSYLLDLERDRLKREVYGSCDERLVGHVNDAIDAIGKAIAALDKYLSKAGA